MSKRYIGYLQAAVVRSRFVAGPGGDAKTNDALGAQARASSECLYRVLKSVESSSSTHQDDPG
jgi:hypothetical protein